MVTCKNLYKHIKTIAQSWSWKKCSSQNLNTAHKKTPDGGSFFVKIAALHFGTLWMLYGEIYELFENNYSL